MRTTQLITTNLGSDIPLVMLITWLDFRGILLETLFFCQIFFEYFGCVFSRSNALLDISQEWLVRLVWNEKEVHWLDTGWTMRPWPLTLPMTLTFDFSRSNFKIAISQEWLSDWCDFYFFYVQKENKSVIYWADCMVFRSCPLTTPMTLTL